MGSWSTTYREKCAISGTDTADSADTTPKPAGCVSRVSSVIGVENADDIAERAAIGTEPALPPAGSQERDRLESVQRVTLAGLMAVAGKPGGTPVEEVWW